MPDIHSNAQNVYFYFGVVKITASWWVHPNMAKKTEEKDYQDSPNECRAQKDKIIFPKLIFESGEDFPLELLSF